MKATKFMVALVASFACAITAKAQDISQIEQMIEQGQYKQAALKLRPLADGGNAEAQYLAATLFLEGKGVVRSLQQAFKYASLAADHPLPQRPTPKSELEDIPSDKDVAVKNAKILTAWMTFEGIGTKKDTSYAANMDVALLNELAEKALKGDYYLPANERLAFAISKLATEVPLDNNYPEYRMKCLARLSKLCHGGLGTKQDSAKALAYATMLEECTDGRTYEYYVGEFFYLDLINYYKEHNAEMYFLLLKNKKRYKIKDPYFSKKVNKWIYCRVDFEREREKCFKELIKCYIEGKGCQKDEESAVKLIDSNSSINEWALSDSEISAAYKRVKSAAKRQSINTIKNIGQNLDEESLRSLFKEYVAAQDADIFREWLRQAEAGSPSAMWMVSKIYEIGAGVQKDIIKSREWAQKAVDTGMHGIWEEQHIHLKSIPLEAGEICNQKVVISSFTETSSSKLVLKTIDMEIKEYNANEIKKELKSKQRTFIWRDALLLQYLTSHLKIYAEARKRIGQPMPAGKYWAFTGTWGKEEAWLLTVNTDGEISEKKSIKNLTKSEQEQPCHFLVEHAQYIKIKQGEPIVYQ
ncbi:MAG: hypothetical protein K6G08_01945 [Prevotella sp.]|nr:hypothetical protein [Prevotella sp.]